MCLVGNKRADIARVIPCKNNFCTKFAHRFHFCGLQKLNTLNLRLFHPPLNPCNHFPTVLIKTNWYTISYKFQNCKSLASVTLPSGVERIKYSAFNGCESLRSITLPSNVKEIGSNAFSGCKGLTSIYAFMEKPCKIQETAFESETKINATLYVPKGSLLDYWDDNQWKKFMNIEEFDATSIGSLNTNANDIQEVSRYSDNGQRLNTPAKGLNIVKYNNGTVKKIMVK